VHLDGLIVQVQAAPDENQEELADWTQRLRRQLEDLDVDSVGPVREDGDPSGAKGLALIIGRLAVRLGNAALGPVVAAVAGWAARTDHSVKVTYNGDVLEVGRATRAQQEQIINDFLARHAPPPPDARSS
jgi:hypothetical protein